MPSVVFCLYMICQMSTLVSNTKIIRVLSHKEPSLTFTYYRRSGGPRQATMPRRCVGKPNVEHRATLLQHAPPALGKRKGRREGARGGEARRLQLRVLALALLESSIHAIRSCHQLHARDLRLDLLNLPRERLALLRVLLPHVLWNLARVVCAAHLLGEASEALRLEALGLF